MTEPDPSEQAIAHAELEIEGVLTDASNLTARVLLRDVARASGGSARGEGAPGETATGGRPSGGRALYKPVRGEAPLRDFPEGTLGRREVAAYLVSAAGGWDLIPVTVLRDGPLGLGSVQRWVDWEAAGHQPGEGLLEVFQPSAVPQGWRVIVHGEDASGGPVVVAHVDAPDLASMAVLDLVLNNADRKGAHLVRDIDGHLWGFDHGLTLHVEDKLRTVLWGWAGEPLPEADVARLTRLRDHLSDRDQVAERIVELVSAQEWSALSDRICRLLADPVFPEPPTKRYPLPWPLW